MLEHPLESIGEIERACEAAMFVPWTMTYKAVSGYAWSEAADAIWGIGHREIFDPGYRASKEATEQACFDVARTFIT